MSENSFDVFSSASKSKARNFTKYIRRQTLARFLVQEQLFRLQMPVKGSIVECGVHEGGGLMAYALLSATLEPYNYRRKIIGFDTFGGFPAIHEKDGVGDNRKVGYFEESYDTFAELNSVIATYDSNRFLSEIPKVQLVKGDATKTIPDFIRDNPHTLISMLYLDFDIFEPTAVALKSFLPRMPKGAVIAFDEVNNASWPGETRALLETLDLNKMRLQCCEIDPNISWIVID